MKFATKVAKRCCVLRTQIKNPSQKTWIFGGAGGFTLRVKFVRYANRRILCPSRLRQGEPTRDGQRGSNPQQLYFIKTKKTASWLS